MSPTGLEPRRRGGAAVRLTLAVLLPATALLGGARGAAAQITGFPHIPVWAFPGAWQDYTHQFPNRCVGELAVRPDSIRPQPRTITVRWLRSRTAEARLDFGGYRVYRITSRVDPVTGRPDTGSAVLLRRFSVNAGDSVSWNFSRVDTTTFQYMCHGKVVNDSILTFVDPDSSGSFYKACRVTDPPDNPFGRCLSPGDSVFKLIAPPGPHDGFRTWYTVTYEAFNQREQTYEDLFVPDLTGIIGPCFGPAPDSCYNLNNKLTNVIAEPVEPSAGPRPDLERVAVVPNPYRATEAWDPNASHEVHFINLPPQARIKIYTVAGDLVAELEHSDTIRDFERWDLRNQNGQEVSSGIYVYRVESATLTFQHRFVVIR